MSSNKADFNLREMTPLSHKTLHSQIRNLDEMGQRTSQRIILFSNGYRDFLVFGGSHKGFSISPVYGADVRDSTKSGLSCADNRHLHYLAESISVNVGGSYQNGKESSPLMTDMSVGAAIVVGDRKGNTR